MLLWYAHNSQQASKQSCWVSSCTAGCRACYTDHLLTKSHRQVVPQGCILSIMIIYYYLQSHTSVVTGVRLHGADSC